MPKNTLRKRRGRNRNAPRYVIELSIPGIRERIPETQYKKFEYEAKELGRLERDLFYEDFVRAHDNADIFALAAEECIDRVRHILGKNADSVCQEIAVVLRRAAGAQALLRTSQAASRQAKRPTPPRNPEGRTDAADDIFSLPALPPGLEWPATTFAQSPFSGKGKREGIIKFLRTREWQSILKSDFVVTRQLLKKLDYSAWKGLENYLRNHELPKDINILTDDDLARDLARGQLGAIRSHGIRKLHT